MVCAEGIDRVTDNGVVDIIGPVCCATAARGHRLLSVVDAEGCDRVTGNGDVGRDGRSNEIVGSVRCSSAGRKWCLHPSVMSLTQRGSGNGLPTPVAVSGAGSCPQAETRRER